MMGSLCLSMAAAKAFVDAVEDRGAARSWRGGVASALQRTLRILGP
jgi:hypothetical protein